MEPKDPDNIAERVSALESQVGDLNRRVRSSEQDAQAARVLAGAADRDVTDLGGEVRGLRGEFNDLRGEFHDFRGEVRGEFHDLRGEVRENHREFNDFRKATMSSFNALRADMNDRFKLVDDGFAEMRAKLDFAAAGQQQIVSLIQGLIDDRGGGPR